MRAAIAREAWEGMVAETMDRAGLRGRYGDRLRALAILAVERRCPNCGELMAEVVSDIRQLCALCLADAPPRRLSGTKEQLARFLELQGRGASTSVIARRLGIDYRTVQGWEGRALELGAEAFIARGRDAS